MNTYKFENNTIKNIVDNIQISSSKNVTTIFQEGTASYAKSHQIKNENISRVQNKVLNENIFKNRKVSEIRNGKNSSVNRSKGTYESNNDENDEINKFNLHIIKSSNWGSINNIKGGIMSNNLNYIGYTNPMNLRFGKSNKHTGPRSRIISHNKP